MSKSYAIRIKGNTMVHTYHGDPMTYKLLASKARATKEINKYNGAK